MSVIEKDGVAITFDATGRALAMRAGARRWELVEQGLVFRLGGEDAEVVDVSVGDGFLQATLRNEQGAARLRITAADSVCIAVEPLPDSQFLVVGLDIFLPEDAEVHLPAGLNTGWKLGADMPVGEKCRFGQTYQFALVRFGSEVLRLTTKWACRPVERTGQPGGGRKRSRAFEIMRVDAGYRLVYTWRPDGPVHLELFDSIEAATDDYAAWLEKAFDVQPRGVAPHRPDWLWNTRLVFNVDLWRSHGEISHTYQDVIDLVKELRGAGAPEDTLLYLYGWSWRFDGHYPEYRPSPVLGGKAKFQEMVTTAHENGCRVMLHLCGPAYDPYLRSFQEFKSDATIGTEDKRIPRVWEPQGEERILTWLGGLITPFPYDSGRQRLTHAWDGGERFVSFDVREVPTSVEAYLTLGGVPAEVRVTVNGRAQESREAGLTGTEGASFPFPFFLEKGRNTITVEALGGPVEDWSTLWYHIHDAKVMREVWTHPIAGMNINKPMWQNWFVQMIVELVSSTGVDAIHLDTHHVGVSLWDWREPLAAIRNQLPGLVFGSEAQDEQGLQTFAITQSSSLWPYLAGPFTPGPGPGGEASWRHRSRVSRLISSRYIRNYAHLIRATGFVPTGTVVNHNPPSMATGRMKQALEAVLNNADELGMIPTLRVNYREYGLDPATRAFVAAMGNG